MYNVYIFLMLFMTILFQVDVQVWLEETFDAMTGSKNLLW